VVQQPNVRVGLVPSGVTSEVWIAPQQSVKRKAKAKGEELVEELTVELQIIPDAHIMTLEQLQSEYGKDVRLALKPDAIYKAITGSHIRVCAFQTSLKLSLYANSSPQNSARWFIHHSRSSLGAEKRA
jgi:hypothetical protein